MNENVNICITPKGDKPVLHFSQFDNERVFTVTVLADDGESAAVLTGLDIEFRLRKTDSHVVTIAPESVADNVITFKTTEQLCACCGQNIASVVLMKDDMVISTLDILVDIQRDILSGGLTSESDIRNLTTQIEQIVPEVVGDDYYNKQEVDDLLAEHTFDPTNYYDKQEVDELIAEHTFDPSNYYDKSDVDDLLEDKADADDVYTKAETDNLLADKADESAIASLIVQKDAAKAPIASFNTDLAEALTKIIVDINPVQSGSGTPSPSNVRPISGFTSANIVRCGVNLLNPDTLEKRNVTSTNIMRLSYAPMWLGGGSYTLSFRGPQSIYLCDINNNYATTEVAPNMLPYTFTLAERKLIMFRFSIDTVGELADTNIQLELGNYSEYHAYNGQTATVNFGQTVYGGVADVTNGKVTLTHKYKLLTGDASETWYTYGDSGWRLVVSDQKGDGGEGWCNVAPSVSSVNVYGVVFGISTTHIYFAQTVSAWGCSTEAQLRTWLSNNNVEIVYPLATPIEITTTPENLTAISGVNNVYSDTNGDTEVRFTETIGNELGV